jgi:hypothetical protein
VERVVHYHRGMRTTIGQLVSTLFDVYDDELHDERLAAVATQVRIVELTARKPRTQRAPTGQNAA